jgi:para-nitrobenzyl esterase
MQGRLFADMIFRDNGPSENCLSLNVWTPADSADAHLPVMVWIYGGGFQAGSSSEPRQDGENLAKKGVVVVSMNYRLGMFGFLALPELTKESDHNASGNYGLLDQLAALQWVSRNIQAFGGDPKKVTIFGESAGSFSVSAQVASPLAKGLFQGAIGESGSFFSTPGRPETTLAAAETNGQKFATTIGATSLEALRAVPADQLLQDALKDRTYSFWPDIDGYFLPQTMEAIYAAGSENHVPLLAGWNANEGGIGGGKPPVTVQTWSAKAHEMFHDRADQFLELFPGADDAQARGSADFFAGAVFISLGTWEWIQAHQATSGSAVFRYLFEQAPPMANGPSRGAYHSAEIEFVFDNLAAKDLPWTPDDYKLAKTMSSYWTNFAKTGNPNSSGLPKWPQYRKKTHDMVMHLSGSKTVAKPAKDQAQFEFLAKHEPTMPHPGEN